MTDGYPSRPCSRSASATRTPHGPRSPTRSPPRTRAPPRARCARAARDAGERRSRAGGAPCALTAAALQGAAGRRGPAAARGGGRVRRARGGGRGRGGGARGARRAVGRPGGDRAAPRAWEQRRAAAPASAPRTRRRTTSPRRGSANVTSPDGRRARAGGVATSSALSNGLRTKASAPASAARRGRSGAGRADTTRIAPTKPARAHAAAELEPVHARHGHVEEDRRRLAGSAASASSAARRDGRVEPSVASRIARNSQMSGSSSTRRTRGLATITPRRGGARRAPPRTRRSWSAAAGRPAGPSRPRDGTGRARRPACRPARTVFRSERHCAVERQRDLRPVPVGVVLHEKLRPHDRVRRGAAPRRRARWPTPTAGSPTPRPRTSERAAHAATIPARIRT